LCMRSSQSGRCAAPNRSVHGLFEAGRGITAATLSQSFADRSDRPGRTAVLGKDAIATRLIYIVYIKGLGFRF
jgi:hypothetical protein